VDREVQGIGRNYDVAYWEGREQRGAEKWEQGQRRVVRG
jgi:hypothetical protein